LHNRLTTVEDLDTTLRRHTLIKWREIKAVLEANPNCLKDVNLSDFEILPVVCLTHVPFLSIGPETDFIAPGLRSVVSISELQSWLGRSNAGFDAQSKGGA